MAISQNFPKKQEKAARLAAEDVLTDEQIAAECGITRRTLTNWKANRDFSERVTAIAGAYAQRALKHGLARRERRVSVLNDLHQRMLQVIEERAADEGLAAVPGGKTGLITRNLKGIGKGEDFQIVEVFEVDTGTLREIRSTQEQVAKELGQWSEKRELKLKRLDDMTDDELRELAGDNAGNDKRSGAPEATA